MVGGTRGRSLTTTEATSDEKSQKCHEERLQAAGESTIDQASALDPKQAAIPTEEEAGVAVPTSTIEAEATEARSEADLLEAVVTAELASAAAASSSKARIRCR